MKELLLCLCCMLSCSSALFSQRQDVKGSEDHPLISRFDGFYIGRYEAINFDKYALPLGPGKGYQIENVKILEGKVIKISYNTDQEERPSLYELVKNYELALEKRSDAKLLFGCDEEVCGKGDPNSLVAIMAKDKVLLNQFMRSGTHAYRAYAFSFEKQQYYAAIYASEVKNGISYELHIIEADELETNKVTAADLKTSLENTGKQAFYGINFAFGKAEIEPSSAEELQVIATYIKENQNVACFLVGHTDAVGSYEQNLKLSTARAQAVLAALQKDYNVDTKYLQAVGVGPVSPVATNQTEEGRAKNRRVELVVKNVK